MHHFEHILVKMCCLPSRYMSITEEMRHFQHVPMYDFMPRGENTLGSTQYLSAGGNTFHGGGTFFQNNLVGKLFLEQFRGVKLF